MVPIQHLAGGLHIDALLGALAPGQLQHIVQIIAQHCGLSGTVGLLFQTAQLLVQLIRHLLGQLGLSNALAVFGDLAVSLAVLPQLLLEDLQLLPQHIVPLTAGEMVPHLVLHLMFQLQDLYFPAEVVTQLFQTADRAQLLQNGLLVPGAHGQILGDVVGDIPWLLAGQH